MSQPTSYAYQWRRNGEPIPGATSSKYTLAQADANEFITCTLTATNAGGSVSEVTSPTVAVAEAAGHFPVGISMGADLAMMNASDRGVSQYEAMAGAGFTTVRLDAGYTADHSVYCDATIRAAVAAGLDVMLILDGYNTSISLASFVAFCASVVSTYSKLGCHRYEILNEENWYVNWDESEETVDPTSYAALLRACYTAVKGADPESTVIMGGMATFSDSDGASLGSGKYSKTLLPVTFMSHVYAALGGTSAGAFDAVAVHPYTFPRLPTASGGNFGQALSPVGPSVRTVMVDNGDSEKKIWVTEFGAPTGSDDGQTGIVTEAVQAQSFSTALSLCAMCSYVAGFYCFNWNDDQDGEFGLHTASYVPKPALAAVVTSLGALGL